MVVYGWCSILLHSSVVQIFFGGGGVTGIPIKNPPTDEIFEEWNENFQMN